MDEPDIPLEHVAKGLETHGHEGAVDDEDRIAADDDDAARRHDGRVEAHAGREILKGTGAGDGSWW